MSDKKREGERVTERSRETDRENKSRRFKGVGRIRNVIYNFVKNKLEILHLINVVYLNVFKYVLT